MKKSTVVSVLLCFSILFLVLQFDIISYVSKPRPAKETGVESRHHTAVTSGPIRDQFANVKTFTSACDEHRVEAFLVDPVILDKIMTNHSNSQARCRFFCTQDKVISFAVLASDWRPKEVTASLESSGFTIVTFMDNDPRTIQKDDKASVPVHYFFTRGGFLIHLLVFYERGKDFLWHGALTWGRWEKGDIEEVKINLQQVNFPLHAGAYDWMEVVRVKMDDLAVFAPRFPLLLLKQIPQSRYIECNYSRAKLFFSRNGQDKSSDAFMFRKRARNLLMRAKETLSELGIPFWISSGTLLGWFRQCDTISYSQDVDIGIFIKDYDDRLISAMQSSGLPLKHRFGKPSDSFELSFQSGDVKLDIFFFYEEDDHMWNGGTQAKSGKKFKYIFPKFTMCWIEFLNIRLMAPCETEAYIEANYGPNWLEPVPVWDWKNSPSNVHENGVWPLEEWPDVIQSF